MRCKFNSEVQPPKFKKESRSRGCKAQAFSRSSVAGNVERFFVKNPSNSLKTFCSLAALLPKDKSF